MNVVDIVILAVLAASVIYAVYRGFVGTLLSGVCFLLALLSAVIFGPRLSAALINNAGIMDTVTTYTESTVLRAVSDTDGGAADYVNRLVDSMTLPDPVKDALRDRLYRQGDGASKDAVKSAADREVSSVMIGAISYVICFVLASILLSVVNSLIRHVFRLPLLKQLDWLAAVVFGLLRGALILYVLFLLVPVIASFAPVKGFEELVAQSTLAPVFRSDGYFVRVIGRIL